MFPVCSVYLLWHWAVPGEKQTWGGGWGHGISRGIEEIEGGISKG